MASVSSGPGGGTAHTMLRALAAAATTSLAIVARHRWLGPCGESTSGNCRCHLRPTTQRAHSPADHLVSALQPATSLNISWGQPVCAD